MSDRREVLLELALYLAAGASALAGFGPPSLGTTAWTPVPVPEGALRVVTWNVGGAEGGRPRGFFDRDLEHVAGVLTSLEADLIVLQEMGSASQGARLASRLGSGYALAQAGGVALLARGATIEGQDSVSGARRALLAQLRWRGRDLALAGVHASAFDARIRNREVGRATEALLERGAHLHLLVGDLNLDVDLDKKRDLFSNEVQRDVETYNYVARQLRDAARGRGSTAEPDRRLDYVFVSPSARVLGAGPWKGQRAPGMDHDPVVADLALD